jgi:hypothetical protein
VADDVPHAHVVDAVHHPNALHGLLERRGVPPHVPDHQAHPGGIAFPDDRLCVIESQAQGFLHEHVLACSHRGNCALRMVFIAVEHKHDIQIIPIREILKMEMPGILRDAVSIAKFL